MKKLFLLMFGLLAMIISQVCASDNSEIEKTSEETNGDGTYFGGKKVLIAYFSWGGSAGARMAATLGNSSNMRQLTGRTDIPQAAAVVMQYTDYSDANRYDAPTYVCVGTSDGIASWRTMQSRLEHLEALGIPTEFHAYNGLPHGFGLGTGTVAEGWIDDAVRFWERQSGVTAVSQVKTETKSKQSVYSIDGTRRGKPQKGLNIINNKKLIKQ
ncbi:MAG: alpha/beta hydrolase [Prevotella sp.]